jgi:PmbA protein
MQRDYWYSSARNADSLLEAEAIGRIAAQRSVNRLQPRQVKTQTAPVLYTPEMARSLLGHFIGAIRGGSLYRKASFLLDKKGEQLFPEFFQLQERPHILGALGSAAYDYEGVATRQRDLVKDGRLLDYVLDSYSARKLGLQTTANAGGVRNLELQPGTHGFGELVKTMDKGLLLTEMMGSGVNGITGDYSRGAAGFWVENGEIQYPVAEITVAGNLLDMFKNIAAIGSDMNTDSNTRTGSILVDGLTIAGG